MADRVYAYRARDASGRLTQGSIAAADEAAAVELLRGQGLLVTGIFPGEAIPAVRSRRKEGRQGRMRLASLARLCRQLAVLMQAGVGLSGALQTLAAQAEGSLERRVLETAKARVDAGNSLTAALAESGSLPALFLHMVEAGEVTGRLDRVLERLADYYERDHDLRQRVKGALAYPAVVAAFALVVVGILIVFVVPRFGEVLAGSDVPLPWVTRAVFGLGKFVQARWYAVLGTVGLVAAGVSYYLRTEAGRRGFDRVVLRAPVVGRLAEKLIVARFAETLASLVGSGVPILQSLEVVERVVGNTHIGEGLRRVRSGVKEGAGIAVPLAEAAVFPPVVSQMVAIGEESGALDSLLTRLAGLYEQEVDRGIKSLTSMIEPIIMVFLGVCVALVAAAVILPVFQVTQAV